MKYAITTYYLASLLLLSISGLTAVNISKANIDKQKHPESHLHNSTIVLYNPEFPIPLTSD